MDRTGNPWAKDPIFALDIGTHSVIGIVGYPEERMFHIMGICRMEYPRRAMKDGQIEDIALVADTADQVRRQLEGELELTLTSVYVAAAGRALRTRRASCELAVDSDEPIQQRQVSNLEAAAIQQAEASLEEEQQAREEPLYYIGHSVVQYYLDGYPLSTLIDHRGRRMKVDIIATFLPGEVVESLHAAMRKIGLAVNNVTLEPIAAMNAIIPKELRMLNLALVDIGAGTSDIAVSDGGSVAAYTMATVAGDEITEAIVRDYLVDFETAEQMKLALSEDMEQIPYKDILNFSYTVQSGTLRDKLAPAAQELANEICSHILEANGKAPAAVFMVGGGSKLPCLSAMIAKGLSMEENKVAVGGSNYMKKTVLSSIDVSGPEFATPLGIALTAMEAQLIGKYTVTLNQKTVHIRTKSPSNVMELLMMEGYDRNQLMGRSGRSVTYELDGRKRVVRGGHPTAASITINGKPASITTPVSPNDVIEVQPALPGADAMITVGEAVEGYHLFEVSFNGAVLQAGTVVYLNGRTAGADESVKDLDVLVVREMKRVEDLCQHTGLDAEGYRFFCDGQEIGLDYLLGPGDDIRYNKPAPQAPQARPAIPPQYAAQDGGAAAPGGGRPIRITLNGRPVELPCKEDKTSYQFVDMLNYVDIDPSKPQGDVVLRLNGKNASYLEYLHDQDSVEIRWDKV